jgi:hypothetical protein
VFPVRGSISRVSGSCGFRKNDYIFQKGFFKRKNLV